MLTWEFDKQAVPDAPKYDRLAVLSVTLLMPIGGASGGEVSVACYLRGEQVGRGLSFALEPGTFEAMPHELKSRIDEWLLGILKDKGFLPGGAQKSDRPVPKKETPPAGPPGFAPILG